MSSKGVCAHCGGSDIDKDPARGDAVCTNCGSVLEDQIIVSEVQFQENSIGGTSVIGQYVSSEGSKSHSLGPGFHHGFGKESRALTLQNGKKKIQQVGGQLKLNQHCIDTAYNFFKMAVGRRLTRGRRTTHVVAACLYLVCRTEGTPHMLLDFSDVLQINVYNLGRTYLQLSRELCINVPLLDPCLYIQRFAHRLEFGDKTHDVSMTALRLVQRMKRDWIHAGRRPSGLCGAALLVAARWHDFNRTLRDIIKVAKVCESTIRKRLTEFEDTPSSQLTIDEFQRIDLEEEHDPPSFIAGKKKAKLAQLEDQAKLGEINNEISEMQAEIEKALENSRIKRYKGLDIETSSIGSCSIDNEERSDQVDAFITKELLSDVANSSEPNSEIVSVSEICEKTDAEYTGKHLEMPENSGTETSEKDSDDKDPDVKRLEELELGSVLTPAPWEGSPVGLPCPRPTAASLGLKESIEECLKIPDVVEEEQEGGELDLSGIDDDEIDKLYILNDREAEVKTSMWMRANADYLKEQKEKEEREAEMKEMGMQKPEKKKRKRRKVHIQAHTAGEAIEKILQEKKFSSKINYEVLKDLNRVSDLKKESVPVNNRVESTPVEDGVLAPTKYSFDRRFKRKGVSIESKPVIEGPATKQVKIADIKQDNDVVVESGPIDYANVKEDDGEIEEEYYEEEDEEHISALQLMGHGGVEDYGEGYDEEDY